MKKSLEALAEIERLVKSLRRGWSMPPDEADWMLDRLAEIRGRLESSPGRDSSESGGDIVEHDTPPGEGLAKQEEAP